MIINIENLNVGDIVINRVDITVSFYNLFGGLIIKYNLMSDNDNISTGNIVFTQAEVNDWGVDDSYIIDLVLEKLSLTKITEE